MDTSNGLIHAYQLDGKGGGYSLDWQAIEAMTPDQGPTWVHLDYTHEHAHQWLREKSGLESIIVDALVADETRPRCETIDNGLLICLRGVNSNPGADPEDMVSIRMFCTNDRIITTRKRKLLSISDMVNAIEQGEGPDDTGTLIAMLAQRLTDRMAHVIAELDDRIDALEEEVLAGGGQELQHPLLELRREILKLRRYLSPQREALYRLQNEKVEWLNTDDRLRLREASDKVMRYLEDLDAAKDRASVANEALSNRLAEQMNSRMYVLSLVAALFLPLGFLTGLLGINVGGIPLADDPMGFIEVVIILVVLVVIQVAIFMRKKWF
ncbi:MAG: zinc transporter ZntB [Gammaproteobacteria bacterium]|nr:zinc transporter ZntB [Gammaproteobacteria bacterium]